MSWTEQIPDNEILDKVTDKTVIFADKFGKHLGSGDRSEKMTTTQLRRFFGEVKRQQMNGYDKSKFILLKPQLAYAVGRAYQNKTGKKIEDFYDVMTHAIDLVSEEKHFENFIKVFEAIVAYHKKYETQNQE